MTQDPQHSKIAVLKNPHIKKLVTFSASPTTTTKVPQALLRMIGTVKTIIFFRTSNHFQNNHNSQVIRLLEIIIPRNWNL